MKRMEVWLLCFIPLQLGFDLYMWFSIGNAQNFLKNVVVKVMRETHGKVRGDDKCED